MKTRLGFVSNSSSSSFLIGLHHKPQNPDDLYKQMFPDKTAETFDSYDGPTCAKCLSRSIYKLYKGEVYNDEYPAVELVDKKELLKEVGAYTGYDDVLTLVKESNVLLRYTLDQHDEFVKFMNEYPCALPTAERE